MRSNVLQKVIPSSTPIFRMYIHNIFYMEKVRRMIRDIEEGKSFSLKNFVAYILKKYVFYAHLSSISLTLTPVVMRENMKNLSHSQFTNFQVSTRHDSWCLLGYWLAQVPLTYTHIWNVVSVFFLSFLSPKHEK